MQDFGSGDTSSNLVGGILIFITISPVYMFYMMMPDRK
jgi:hypothetical protein